MRKIDECDMGKFGTPDGSEKTIAIKTAKQEGGKSSKKSKCNTCKKRNDRPNVGGVSIRSRNGAPSRKGCMRGQW